MKRDKLPIAIVLVAMAVMRFILISKGHFWLQDELRYRYAWAFIRDLVSLQPIKALQQLFEFNLYARPGLVIFNLPAAILQVVFLILTGVKTETPLSLTIPSLIQVLASLMISWLVYRLALRYLKSRLLAVTGVIIHGLLVNTNLYLRHIVPYDTALLVYLWFLELVLRHGRKATARALAASGGLVSAFMHTVYPAYYPLTIVLGFLITFLSRKRWWIKGVIFAGSFLSFLLITEASSWWLGNSYLATAKFVAGRVVIGSPQETPIFLYRYLGEIEGTVGKILMILFSLFLVHFIVRFKHYHYEFRLLTIAIVGVYLVHGVSGPLLGKVYYGRSMHVFFWFVVLGTMMVVQQILPRAWLKYTVAFLLVVITLISFSRWYPKFLALEYPTDVLYNLCQNDCINYVSFVNENYPPDDPGNRVAPTPKWLAVNFGKFFIPVNETQYSYDTLGGKLVYQQPHPLNFPAYQFEGHSVEERRRLQQHHYQMKLYRLK